MEGFIFKDIYLEEFTEMSDSDLGLLVRCASVYHRTKKVPILSEKIREAFELLCRNMADVSQQDSVKAEKSHEYRPADDLTDKEINDLVFLNSTIIPGIEKVCRMAGIKMNPWTHETILKWLTDDKYTPDEITDAIKTMASYGKCSLPYAEGILKNEKKDRRAKQSGQPPEGRTVSGGIQDQQNRNERKHVSKYVC